MLLTTLARLLLSTRSEQQSPADRDLHMTSNIYKLRNVPRSHRRFQAGVPGPEEQIEAPLDF